MYCIENTVYPIFFLDAMYAASSAAVEVNRTPSQKKLRRYGN